MKRSKPTGSSKKSSPPRRPERQSAAGYLAMQRRLAAALMTPLDAHGQSRVAGPAGRALKKTAAAIIKPNDRLTAMERLEIYNRQYWFRLKDCFYDDYPGLRAILGEKKFDQLCEAYLLKHPSRSYSLRNLGQDLLGFLRVAPGWKTAARGPLMDMARLEWAHIEAFDNEERPKLEVKSLLDVDPSRIVLRLQPYLTLLKVGWELDEFLIEIKRRARAQEDASNAVELNRRRGKPPRKPVLRRKPVLLAIHRQNTSVFYKRLQPGQFFLLMELQAGQSLAAACESLMAKFPADADAVQSWFQTWAELGWFCRMG